MPAKRSFSSASAASVVGARDVQQRSAFGLRGGIGIVLGPAVGAVEEGGILGFKRFPPEPRGAQCCRASASTGRYVCAPARPRCGQARELSLLPSHASTAAS
jgi:hypothetical protein